jgi:glycosidase
MTRLNGDVRKAKVLHLLQLTVRGVPCMYQGEEIGMTDARFPYKTSLDPLGQKYKSAPRFIFDMGGETMNRDELRTPMQWDTSINAGFSTAKKTWLPVHTDFSKVNVEIETSDDNSLLREVQQLLKIRKELPALRSGALELSDTKSLPKGVLAYKRKTGEQEIMVVLNFNEKKEEISLSGTWTKLFSINKTDNFAGGKISLDTFGGMILRK